LSYLLSRHRKLVLAAVPTTAAVLLTAGCSGGSGSSGAPPSVTFATDVSVTPGMSGMTGMPAMSSMPGMAGMPAGSGSTAAAPTAAAPVGPNAVDINNFAFGPTTLTVPVGTTVTWTNRDEEPHTVVSSDGSTFHSPGMGTGGTYSFKFDKPGTFDYVCSIHPCMHGTVVVTA
jgi:plastocyanin